MQSTLISGKNPVIRIGISRCLLGEPVRYDGGHKRDSFVTGTLSKYFQWVPVCPEVEIGLGTPRESLHLVARRDGIRMVGVQSGMDHTRVMNEYSVRRSEELSECGLHGYILKKDSPSCGMERVRIFPANGVPEKKGKGLYAEALMKRLPLLPVEEEGRLQDLQIRENFIERIFCYYRWSQFFEDVPNVRKLIAFHTRHKLTILSHSRRHYDRLGRLTANSATKKFREVIMEYGALFMEALKTRASTKRHSDVLYHLLGFLKSHISSEDKRELIEQIEAYRKGFVPLVVPLVLLRHHLMRYPIDWVMEQTYLNPYPAELMLRNHV